MKFLSSFSYQNYIVRRIMTKKIDTGSQIKDSFSFFFFFMTALRRALVVLFSWPWNVFCLSCFAWCKGQMRGTISWDFDCRHGSMRQSMRLILKNVSLTLHRSNSVFCTKSADPAKVPIKRSAVMTYHVKHLCITTLQMKVTLSDVLCHSSKSPKIPKYSVYITRQNICRWQPLKWGCHLQILCWK